MEDRALLAAISRGDRTSFDKFYNRYRSLVRAIAFRILEDFQEAEDASQEAFITLLRVAYRYREARNPKAVISRIATNTALTIRHKKQLEATKTTVHAGWLENWSRHGGTWQMEDRLDNIRRLRRYSDPSRHESCQICGKTGKVVKRSISGGAICRNCYTKAYYRDTSKHEPCSKCGRIKRVASRNGFGKAICPNCYKKDPSRYRPCSRCGQLKPVEVRDDSGKDTCKTCHYKDPSKYIVCSKCGKIRPIQTRDSSGNPLCSTCDKLQRRTKKPIIQRRRRPNNFAPSRLP